MMKKRAVGFLMMVTLVSLTACGKQNEDAAVTGQDDSAYEDSLASDQTEIAPEESGNGAETEAGADAEANAGEAKSETEADATVENGVDAETGTDAEPRYITIDFSQTQETHPEGADVTPLTLKVVSEEGNGIDMAYEWYDRERLSLPMIGDGWDHFYDDEYEYQWVGDALYIYEKETEACLYVLSYPTDKWYVNGNNAYLKDGIFYGGSVMNGYAQPNTCFLFAYDLDQDELVWRSADQSYNSMNFLVKGDVILCGYGFTEEDDYLYQINRNTGEIIDRLLLKKKPDLLIEQDGKLYVHTYSYDYVIEMD
jgi:hypothetical protein